MVNISRLLSWSKHLRDRRGSKIFRQTVRMFHYHMQPFQLLLTRIYDVLSEYEAGFTYPLVASTAKNHLRLVEMLKSYPYEIAIHGYKHVRYQHLTYQQQDRDFFKAIRTFKELKIPYNGFRAPYDNYTQDTIELVEKYKFKWDIGIGYRPEYRKNNTIFNAPLQNGKLSSYSCVPLNVWSDDSMIDRYKMSAKQIGKTLISQLKLAKSKQGVLMFDLHPIRLGQKHYVSCLIPFLEYAQKINAWLPTVSEAIEYWNKHQKWKHDAPVCCLLTGDIDNFTFWDYLRRF